MNSKIFAVFFFLLVAGMAVADEATEEFEKEMDHEYTTSNDGEMSYSSDEEPSEDEKAVDKVNEVDGETSALVQQDSKLAKQKAGFCHYGIAVWYKPGYQIRCGCLTCTCRRGGAWDCIYNFSYCPYYYCGNRIFNPKTQICCCGRVHEKRSHYSCCGYHYYDVRTSKCCNYYTVKSNKAKCPRHKI